MKTPEKDTEPGTPSGEKKKTYTRLKPAQWETLVVLYELGKVTVA
tara:strand:+ start:300 stop:434 length:135 start_codon:yes stop_codon:yes gene_type:complete